MAHIPQTELVAVCDIIPERAQKYAERFHVPQWYPNIDELLAHCDFDILMDTASIPAHHEINMKALQAGKHLYSQKPVGLTVEQVTEQMEAAQKAGVKFAASPIHPLRPDILFIRDMIQNGAIGKVTMVRCGPTQPTAGRSISSTGMRIPAGSSNLAPGPFTTWVCTV